MADPWVVIPNEEYHGGPGVSRSFLWEMINTTPRHAKYRKTHRSEPTEAMLMGTALHTLVLEPEIFEAQFIMANVSRRSATGKEVHQTYAANGVTILKPDQWNAVHRMAENLMAHPIAGDLLRLPGRSEMSLFARHPLWDFDVKVRPDRLLPDGTILDVKTCACAALRPFRSHAYSMGYHMQAAMYPQVMRYHNLPVPDVGNFVFLAVENVEPHCVAVYYADEEMLRDGLEAYEKACELYHQCSTTEEWPGYPEMFLPLNAPGWARSQRKDENVYQS